MDEYVLYRRRNLLRGGEIAWQINKGKRVFESTSYKESVTLEEFAERVALRNMSPINQRIGSSDRLTTIVSVFVPGNNYIDESVSARELVKFWRAYSKAIDTG